jgi:hypothetical protein
MREAVRDEFLTWIEKYWWRFIGVLTFRGGIRVKRARALLLTWIRQVERDEGHRLSYMAVLEVGSESDHPHFHVMIAGITSRLERYFHAWEEIAGFAKLTPFRSSIVRTTAAGLVRSAGIDYALKSLAKEDFEFEAELHDEHLLPRHRRSLEAAEALTGPEERLCKPQDGGK